MRYLLIAIALVCLVVAGGAITIAGNGYKPMKLVIELQIDPQTDKISTPEVYVDMNGKRDNLKNTEFPENAALKGLEDFVVFTAASSPGCIYYKSGGVLKKYCW